ncbi:MAG TPA: DUF5063 domain-containing protein, partial [Longimicrobiaceae bacterium]
MTSLTDTPAVQAFVSLAREYCAVIENREPADPVALLRAVQPLLPALCHAALALPELGEIDVPDEHPGTASEEELDRFMDEWRPLYQGLTRELDTHNWYWEVYDPYELSEPINGSLADDLGGIYMDLIRGLRAWGA